MKKILILLIFIFILSGTVVAAEDLIVNGSFSSLDGWDYSSTGEEGCVATLNISGKNYMQLYHADPQFSSFQQNVWLESDKTYRLQCSVSVDSLDVDDFFVFFGDFILFPSEFGATQGQFCDITFYATARSEYNALLRFDFGSANYAEGRVLVSDVSLMEVDEVPTGAKHALLQDQGTDQQEESHVQKHINKDNQNIILPVITFAIAFLLFFFAAIYKDKFKYHFDRWGIFAVIGIFAFLKLVFAFSVYGHYYDMSCFSGWASGMVEHGFSGFYSSGIFCDYPPGYLYILYPLGFITNTLGFGTLMQGLVLKLPAIICEVGIACLAYKLVKPRVTNPVLALIIPGLIMANPIFLFDTSLWGQVDAVICLLMLSSVYMLMKDKKLLAAFIFALALLIKPQALIVAPVFILPYIAPLLKRETLGKGLGTLLLSLLIGAATLLALILPFQGEQDFFWFLEKFFGTALSYPFATINAANFYGALGANYVDSSQKLLFIDYQTLSYIFVALTVTLCVYLYFRHNKNNDHLFLLGAVMFGGVFLLGPNMHERYIVPVVYFLAFALIYTFDYRLLYSYVALSAVGAGNILLVLMANEYHPGSEPLVLLSVLTTFAFVYFFYAVFKSYAKPKGDLKIGPKELVVSTPKEKHITKRDKLMILLVTAAYAIIAYMNLGSTQVPMLGLNVTAGDDVTVVLAEPSDIKTFKYYSGLGDADFTLEFTDIKKNDADMYKWQYVDLNLANVSQVNLHVNRGDLTLLEIAFADEQGGLIPIGSVSHNGRAAETLFDEQVFVPGSRSSYMYEMYFDEVYHARTAFEHLEGIPPYEITHPPLGKVILGLGIQWFGMNPFGWRFMGTLFGVLMIPLMYIFAKRLFGSTFFALLPTILFLADFMHFAQTRIATIDSYSVFFIMLMYYFMYQYTQTDRSKQSFLSTMVPLMLSGVAFGLGAATKWLCIYAGAGLAAIFFYQLFVRKQEIIKTLLVALVFFIIIPLGIYLASYIPYTKADPPYGFAEILGNQKYMFEYHGFLTTDQPHPFESKWYTWPLNIRPMFFYMGSNMPEGYISGISSFGNPFVWWGGLVATIGLLVLRIKNKITKCSFVLVAIASQFLPWVFITRETFIYHYFASVPFLILLTVYFLKYLCENYSWGKKASVIYVAACMALFLLFYPVISGLPVQREFSDTFLRWFQSWPFY